MNEYLKTPEKPEIPLLIVGYDFRIASSGQREKLVTTQQDREQLFKAIRNMDPLAGLLVLETCNRMEWIVSSQMPLWVSEILKARMFDLLLDKNRPNNENTPLPYVYTGANAVVHVLKVVVGMESLAVGEAQIAGQFQAALQRAQKEKTSSVIINRLGHSAGRIAKSGYRIGFRANFKQGIHGLVTEFLGYYFKDGMKTKTILVAGMGEIGRKTAALIEQIYGCQVQPLNRTIKPEHRGKWAELTELKHLVKKADALVVATSAPEAVIGIKDIGNNRENKLLVMDIGIPRQVTESVQSHPSVDYRNIDHLLELGAKAQNTAYLEKLESEIRKELERFRQNCRGREMTDLLSSIHFSHQEFTWNRIPEVLRSQLSDLDEVRRKKIEKAMKQIIKEYSYNLFLAFHRAMETHWNNNSNEK